MRRSAQIAAPLLAAAALAITDGCRRPEMQRCVDENNAVVDNHFCTEASDNTAAHYRYYYGGTGDFELGGLVSNGGFSPVQGRTYSIKRGGFGGTFSIGEILAVAGVIGAAIVFGPGE